MTDTNDVYHHDFKSKEIKALSESEHWMLQLKDACQKAACSLINFGRAVNAFCKDKYFKFACSLYPNSKTVHLAKYGKNRRIRKKNRDIILRWAARYYVFKVRR